jgi:hypothetical protein
MERMKFRVRGKRIMLMMTVSIMMATPILSPKVLERITRKLSTGLSKGSIKEMYHGISFYLITR